MAEDHPRRLAVHGGRNDEYPVFLPDSCPAFSGGSTGITWLCPRCEAVLIEGASHEEQFLDVLFRCFRCGQLGASPVRGPGRPVPARAMVVPPGHHRLGSTVHLRGGTVMVISEKSVASYVAETGAGHPVGNGGSVLTGLNPEGLRRLAAEAVELLGEPYARLRESDERGRESATPPSRRHRLIELIEYARLAAVSLESAETVFAGTGRAELDANSISELISTVALFRRWQNHPSWTHLVRSLASGTEVQHTIMTLGVASYLVDAKNGVGIIGQEGEGRIPDLWVEPTLLERLEVEVKTPLALRGPRATPLQTNEVIRLIERQVDRAASGKRGQINPSDSGIVAIGGFHLEEDLLQRLEEGATDVLNRQASRKPHLAAVLVSNLSYSINQEVRLGGKTTRSMGPTMTVRVVEHPGYKGTLEVRRST